MISLHDLIAFEFLSVGMICYTGLRDLSQATTFGGSCLLRPAPPRRVTHRTRVSRHSPSLVSRLAGLATPLVSGRVDAARGLHLRRACCGLAVVEGLVGGWVGWGVEHGAVAHGGGHGDPIRGPFEFD